jgi:hypothetical protein
MVKKTGMLLCMLFFASLIIRLAFNVYCVGLQTAPGTSVLRASDEGKYHDRAVALARGEGFGNSAHTPPGLPIMLSGIYKVFGENIAFARLIQTLLSSLMVIFLFFIARFVFGERAGFVAASIASIYPFFVFWTGAVITETLFVFLCVAGVLSVLCYLRKDKGAWNVLGGLIFGYAALTRPVVLTMPVFIFLSYLLYFRNIKKAVMSILVFVVLFAAVILPWTIRNYIVFKKIVPIATISGVSLLNGMNSIILNDPSEVGEIVYKDLPEYLNLAQADEVTTDRQAGKIARAYYRAVIDQDPRLLLRIEWEKFKDFWAVSPKYRGTGAKIISLMSFGVLLPFFIVGLCTSMNNKAAYLLFFFIFNIFCIGMIYYANIRYRFPMEPFYIVYASYGIVKFAGSISSFGNKKQ